jgi:hypothetical protein
VEALNGMDTTVGDARTIQAAAGDADRFSLTVLPFVLRLQWAPRLVIDRADIARVGSALVASGRSTLPVLAEVSALKEITWDAREAILGYAHPARIAVVGSDAVDLVLTAFTVRSSSEIRYFTDRDVAVRWLLQEQDAAPPAPRRLQ